jgi:hypothetical protein
VVLATGSVVDERYDKNMIDSLLDIDSSIYSTTTTMQSLKTRYRLYEENPGKIVFYSSGREGKSLFHALSVCLLNFLKHKLDRYLTAILNIHDTC